MQNSQNLLQSSNHSASFSSQQYNQSSIYMPEQVDPSSGINLNLEVNLNKPRNTKQSKKEIYQINETQLKYQKGIGEYISNINKMLEQTPAKTMSEVQNQEEDVQMQDKEIKNIIQQVLDKRRKMSRVSYKSGTDQDQNRQLKQITRKISHQTHIQAVNTRLQQENQQMNKKIKKLLAKIRKLDNFSSINKSNNSINKNISSSKSFSTYKVAQNPTIMQTKQKQLQKLKKRLQNAEKANMRMENQLSKLYQSRKVSKSTLKLTGNQTKIIERRQKPENNLYQIKLNCPHCEKTNINTMKNSKKEQKIIISNATSPFRKDYYSPIMQFQQYSLKNEQTISLYDQSLQKTSQFGIQLMPSQPKQTKSTQVQIKGQKGREQRELDQQIIRLQEIINKNNRTISSYQGILMKQVM